MSQRSAESVLEENTPRLMQIEGVIGTALGSREGRPLILIFVSTLTPELADRVPKTIEGYETSVEETGDIRALGNSSE